MEGSTAGGSSGKNAPPGYQRIRTLGAGSFAKVILALHTLTGLEVAIKIIDLQSLGNSEANKVRREVNILQQLCHAHIVRLFEVIDTPSNLYVVMEYMKSGELFEYLTEKRLQEDEARSIFQQIISGVEHCHQRMVVHRDLKPENILLDSGNNVKIADFGLANTMRDGHFLKTSCGSPNYAAPEVINGEPYAGPEVDVWSCGVILYVLLCGRLPFEDDSFPALFAKIKRGVYSIASHSSEGARDLISRMLVVDPMRRISIPEIRRHPWFKKHLPWYIACPSSGAFNRAEKGCLDHRQPFFHSEPSGPKNWTLGLKSVAPPREVMLEVLKAFHSLNVKWKRIGHYNMECLWQPPTSMCSTDAIKFEIQLYKASAELYAVDLQHVSGHLFMFLEICSAFRALVV